MHDKLRICGAAEVPGITERPKTPQGARDLSFFDEVDEPQTTQRAPRGRPPADQQAIQIRRIVAVVVIVIAIIVIALLVNSCATSQTNDALRNYNNSVYNLMRSSDATGARVFTRLSSGAAKTNLSGLVTDLDTDLGEARSTLHSAQSLSVPNQMAVAQENLLLALTMRRDGIESIANNIQAAMARSTSKTGLQQIQRGVTGLYSSDLVYKDFAVPAIAGAFKNAGLSIGPTTIYGGQVVHDLLWLDPTSIAIEIGAESSTAAHNQAPTGAGTYVVVAGDTLSGIAAKTHVPLATLEQLNPSVNPSALQVGQTLRLH
jgi:LysM repeat protein